MKTNIMNERESDTTMGDAIAKGALVWGPLCSLVSSVALYATGTATGFSAILLTTMLLFTPVCTALGMTYWYVAVRRPLIQTLGTKDDSLPKLNHFVPPGLR